MPSSDDMLAPDAPAERWRAGSLRIRDAPHPGEHGGRSSLRLSPGGAPVCDLRNISLTEVGPEPVAEGRSNREPLNRVDSDVHV